MKYGSKKFQWINEVIYNCLAAPMEFKSIMVDFYWVPIEYINIL